jgi:hypothetical protein
MAYRCSMPSRLATLAAGILLLASAAHAAAPHYEAGPDSAFPRIRYADSLLSVNDRCIVASRKLNLQVRPVYVNRSAVGFC